MYIDKLDDIVNKYDNIYHSTIKTKHVDVKPSLYIDSSKEINDENPKSRIGDIVRISKYKKFFAKVAKNVDLASLQSNVDKLDIDKLKNVTTNLSNLRSQVGKLDVDKLSKLSDVNNLNKLSDVGCC